MGYNLLADIGGTNLRIGQVIDGRIVRRWSFPMVPEKTIPDRFLAVMRNVGPAPSCVIAAGAGPVTDGEISLTNGGWRLSESELSEVTGASEVKVLNDLEAAAYALAELEEEDIVALEGDHLTAGTRVLVGVGTGLGVAVQLQQGAVVSGEGGHVGLAPISEKDVDIFRKFISLWPETRVGDTISIEAEAMLSGTGLPVLYAACGGASDVYAVDVLFRAQEGEQTALTARAFFQRYLGAFCGNLAVTLKATGGVFLTGGVAQANPDLFDQTFRIAFREGGRFTNLRTSCGAYLVTTEDMGLRGCLRALESDRA